MGVGVGGLDGFRRGVRVWGMEPRKGLELTPGLKK